MIFEHVYIQTMCARAVGLPVHCVGFAGSLQTECARVSPDASDPRSCARLQAAAFFAEVA